MPLGEYPGGALTTEQVLVVGTDGGSQLAPHKDAMASWLKAGGHVLAVGLNEADASRSDYHAEHPLQGAQPASCGGQFQRNIL